MKRRKIKKIFILINSLGGGGAERQVCFLQNSLKVEALFLLEDDIQYRLDNTKIILLSHLRRSASTFQKIFLYPFAIWKMKRCGVDKTSSVISFMERSNYLNIISKFFLGHRAIISERTTPSRAFNRGMKRLNNIFIPLLYPFADHIVVNSKGVNADLQSYAIRQSTITTIHNIVDVESRALLTQSISHEHRSHLIVMSGRLIQLKSYHHLIRIFYHVKKIFPTAKLVILGEGNLRDKLIKLSREFQLKTFSIWENERFESFETHDVYFLGFHTNPFEIISQGSLFVLPSLWEGFPNVLLEALASSVLVMSSDCRSGPREILAPTTDFRYETKVPEYAKYGILMPVFDGKWRGADEPLTHEEQIWADEIVKVLSNEELLKRYGEVGKQRAQDFSIEKIIPQWERVIQENCPELSSRA